SSDLLAFVEAIKRDNVSTTVTVFGKEACDVFCSVVCSDNRSAIGTSHGILGNHALASLDISLIKIRNFNTRFFKGCNLPINTCFDVHCNADVWLDKSKGTLGILFVCLHAIWQTHCDKAITVVTCFSTEFFYCDLCQTSCQTRILPT